MSVKRVVFIRPGETDWNINGRWQGWVASPLNAHGKAQVRKLATFIRHIGLRALYASDLQRARMTAELLSEQLGFPPIYDARLRERNIGQWQGLLPDEMRAWYPDDYQQLLADPDGFVVPGGESRAEVAERMRAVFEVIVATDNETVGILSHTTALKMLFKSLFADYDERELKIDNTSVSTMVRGADGIWQLVAADDVSHLEGLATKSVRELEYGI